MPKIIAPEYLARSGTEHGEQAAVFCWAAQNRAQYPELVWMYAIPNGGGRSMAQGAALKAEGVKAGVADICLPVVRMHSRGNCPGLYIEMKRSKGIPSDITKEQVAFAVFVIRQGYVWIPCFGWEQAKHSIISYLSGCAYTHSDHQHKVLKQVWEIANAQDSQVSTTSH